VHKEGLNEIIKKLDLIDFDNLDKNTSLETPKSREDQPTREEWKSLFSDTKENLKDTKLEKLVLARKSLFTFNGALNGFTIKKKLRDTTPECYHFCFQPEENVCFMGASPERFYKREGNKILSEAIAGTRPRGKSNEEDLTLKKELLQSSKDLNEHKLVVDAISQSLNDLCENINSDTTPSVLELCGAYHLKTSFEGTIKDTTEDIDLIQQLHPTPAVAGYPKKEALNFIAKKESFSRGWYAGLFGYIGQNVTEFTVAIRSGLIKNNTISLFAGAGIVSESEETQEWDEIENKMNQFFSVFKNETTT
jgi:menaquinone-specific isochorismate synthase